MVTFDVHLIYKKLSYRTEAQKCCDFWTNRVNDDHSRLRRLLTVFRRAAWSWPSTTIIRHWRVNTASLLRRQGCRRPVRASTAGADLPTFTPVPVDCELRLFTPISSSDVVELVKKLPYLTNSARATRFLHGFWNGLSKIRLRSCVDSSTGPYRTPLSRRCSSSLQGGSK